MCGANLNVTYGARPKDTDYGCYSRIYRQDERSNDCNGKCTLPYIPSARLDDFVLSFVCRALSDVDSVLEELVSDEARQEGLDELRDRRSKSPWVIDRHQVLPS